MKPHISVRPLREQVRRWWPGLSSAESRYLAELYNASPRYLRGLVDLLKTTNLRPAERLPTTFQFKNNCRILDHLVGLRYSAGPAVLSQPYGWRWTQALPSELVDWCEINPAWTGRVLDTPSPYMFGLRHEKAARPILFWRSSDPDPLFNFPFPTAP